ncbi:MAG: PASTA domain-containing protein, partial [Clostridiales bacterium]|nr:PASTA domain-containing protein [Clostridiales bacterium]
LSLGILGTHSGRVNVPNVVGLEQAAAVAAIENEGLKTQVATKEIAPEGVEVAAPAGAAAAAQANGAASGASAAAPATGGNAQTIWVLPGQVLAQDPQAGSLLQKGATVTLTVATATEAGSSVKPVMGVVPDVVGKKQDDAVAAIKAAGFRVGNVVTQASDKDPGIVIAQTPDANSDLEKDKLVSITVSSGPNVIAVPTVAGKSSDDAQQTLANAGFAIGSITEEFSSDYAAGQVTRTDPPAGTQLTEDTPVAIFVSKGPGVTVPNFVGTLQSAANTVATGAGLVFTVSSQQDDATVPAGTVLSQSIASGTIVAKGTAITVIVSRMPLVTLPDFTGQTAAAVTAAGFTVGTTTQAADSSAAGTILSQSPAAGTQVQRGSKVNITVSDGSGAAPAPAPGGP